MGTSILWNSSHYQLLQWSKQIKEPHGSYVAPWVNKWNQQTAEWWNKQS